MRAGSSITSLSPRTVSVEGRSACRNSSDGYTSRFIPSGALSTMNASGSNDLTALMIKEDRRFFRFSKSIDILLGSYTRLATFTAEGNFTRSMPKDMRKALDTVEPVRIKMLVSVSAPTKASASASVRRRWPSPYESCEYIRIFMLPFLLGICVPCSFSRNMRSWWQMFRTAITTSFTKRTLGHSRHHLLPPCLLRKPGEGPFVLHDPISVTENHESAMNPRLFLGTVNRGSEARFLPLAIHYSFPREQNVEPFPRRSNLKLPKKAKTTIHIDPKKELPRKK